MPLLTRFSALLLAGLPLLSLATSSEALLQQTVQCLSSGPFTLTESTSRQSADKFRKVASYKGTQNISVLTGRRLMLSTANGQPFINLKIEISDPAQAEADRAKLRLAMLSHAEKRPDGNSGLRADINGHVETLSLDHDTLKSGLPGYHTMLDLADNRVITLHLLNQKDFRQYSDYARARDAALQLAQGCLAAPR